MIFLDVKLYIFIFYFMDVVQLTRFLLLRWLPGSSDLKF